MKDIAIYGAGGFGREVACLINKINLYTANEDRKWNLIGFFDDGLLPGTQNEYGKVLGNINTLNDWRGELAIVIAVGHPKYLHDIVSKIANPFLYYPNLFAPDTLFYDVNNYCIGHGNIISFGCTISCNVKIGNFNILNGFISMGHDSSIHDFNAVMPGVRISGNVEIGSCNLLGTESVIIQGLKIGNNTTIGANSVVMRNTKDGKTYSGNPARIIEF